MYHMIVKSICEETLVTLLSSWKVLALKIKYYSDSKRLWHLSEYTVMQISGLVLTAQLS